MKKGSTKKIKFSLAELEGTPYPPKRKIEAHQVFLASRSAKRLDALTEEMLLGVKVLCTVWEG